jgi:hypothetical protein
MKSDKSFSPVVIACFLVQLLAMVIGMVVEAAGEKGNLLWKLSICLLLFAGAVIGIDMIVTRRAFYKRRDYEGKDAVVVGIICLLAFGSVFICLIVDVPQTFL